MDWYKLLAATFRFVVIKLIYVAPLAFAHLAACAISFRATPLRLQLLSTSTAWTIAISSSSAVSYTHLTLPTNREV